MCSFGFVNINTILPIFDVEVKTDHHKRGQRTNDKHKVKYHVMLQYLDIPNNLTQVPQILLRNRSLQQHKCRQKVNTHCFTDQVNYHIS